MASAKSAFWSLLKFLFRAKILVPFLLGSEELNNLEYYHAFISSGLSMRALAVQR